VQYMDSWLRRQYQDIKGNAKWALLIAIFYLVQKAVGKLLYLIPNIQAWVVWTVALVLSAIAFVLVAKWNKSVAGTIQQTAPQSPALSLGIPTLSSLQGQQPNITFNANEMFRHAYYSPLTAEVEHNIQVIAAQSNPTDHEAFYARFIGIGLISYIHDTTWHTIFKSQIFMLRELNSKNSLPLLGVKQFYDQAVVDYPEIYQEYPFERWLAYMKGEQLLVHHPSDMLEISNRGKDFLKYLAHWGRDANAKRG
jgi:hypothetical protein